MKNVLKIDFAKKQIIMDRAFAKNSTDTSYTTDQETVPCYPR